MRSICALLLLMGLTLPLVGQPPKKDAPAKEAPSKTKEAPKVEPGSLEDTLEKVLRYSPEIKAAEAKVRDAETELFRVRHQMLSKVNSMFNELKSARRMAELAANDYEKQSRLLPPNDPNLVPYRVSIEKQRAEIERLETELKSLRGEFNLPANSFLRMAFTEDGNRLVAQDALLRVWDLHAAKTIEKEKDVPKTVEKPRVDISPAMVEKLDKLLKMEYKIEFAETPTSDALQQLLEVSGMDMPLRILVDANDMGTITLRGQITGRGWIQAIEESNPELQIVVREYGLLLTTKKRIPAGAMRLLDYMALPRG